MKHRIKKHSKHFLIAFLAGLTAIGIYSYLTNPFVRFSIVQDSYTIDISQPNNFKFHKNFEPIVRTGWTADRLAFAKSGWHIAANRLSRRNSSPPYDLEASIRAIHGDRFNQKNPYIISGDHFSVLYPRSLGIFYHTALDPRTALDYEDWINRQSIYLKTTAYALEVFSHSGHLSTTVVPLGQQAVTLINVYAPPSDTYYSLVYALDALSSSKTIINRYPFSSTQIEKYKPATATAAAELLNIHRADLKRHWQKFSDTVFDSNEGFVKKNIYLSGTKDMAMRESAFYDNIMFWASHKLSQKAKIIPEDKKFLNDYKARILKTYWRDEGFFAEDQGNYKNSYSSDWLIAYQTGFLSPNNPDDLPYLKKAVDYVHSQKIDRPFAVKYHLENRPEQLYWPVRIFAPDYGSTAIWSHWGMEYIKLLAGISSVTKNLQYQKEAQYQIQKYEDNIKKYGGYPELYDSNGLFFKQRMYESVLETGWVVNFEEARAMVKALL